MYYRRQRAGSSRKRDIYICILAAFNPYKTSGFCGDVCPFIVKRDGKRVAIITADTDVQKKLIDTFLNAVFVYDESVTFAFNYSNNGEKVTLSEVDNINGSGDFFECGYDGGDDETRTHYLYNANVALSQMSYAPKRL